MSELWSSEKNNMTYWLYDQGMVGRNNILFCQNI